MARGNWRSGKEHGPAEVGSVTREIDGYVMRGAGSFPTESEAKKVATSLEKNYGLKTHVTKGRKLWTVWKTRRPGQKRLS